MGKRKRGAALRALQRQKAQREEVEERIAEQVAKQRVQDKSDRELFVLDTKQQSVPVSERPSLEDKKQKREAKKKLLVPRLTTKERQQVDQLVERHSKDALTRMAQEGQRVIYDKTHHLHTHRGIRKTTSKKSKLHDMWDEEEEEEDTPKKKQKTVSDKDKDKDDKKQVTSHRVLPPAGTRRPLVGDEATGAYKLLKQKRMQQLQHAHRKQFLSSVDAAQSGQSYRPDPTEHQHALRQALVVEERRQEAEAYEAAPIDPGMSEETKALLIEDSDTSDDEDDEEANESEAPVSYHKPAKKKTRTMRNRQKRVRQMEVERREAKKARIFQGQFSQMRRYNKELKAEEAEHQANQELRREREEAAKKEDHGKNVEGKLSDKHPIAAPTFPVALSAEAQRDDSALRTLIPKGDLVTDRMASFALRNMSAKLPSKAAASKAAAAKKRVRPRKKLRGAAEWQGKDWVIVR